MAPPTLRTILLFPPHLSPNPTTLPLLTALQSLLNVSYTATYCTRPDIFGTSHIRLTDPATFADIIGADGFTVVILAVKSDQRQPHPTESCNGNDDRVDLQKDGELLVDVVATGSVKAVDDEDVRKRAQQRLMPRTAYEESHDAGSECNSRSISSASEELNLKLQALYDERQDSRRVHELQALAVSPAYQGLGLGASVLGTIEWLLGRDGDAVLELARGFDESSSLFIGAHLVSSSSSSQTEMGGRVYGIDLDEVKNALLERSGDAGGAQSDLKPLDKDAANGVETTSLGQVGQRKLVLVAIREIGNEDYYLRRGYKSVGTGVLPLGTWGSEAECTTVYMEKSI